jgi:hypothetical protein
MMMITDILTVMLGAVNAKDLLMTNKWQSVFCVIMTMTGGLEIRRLV